MFKKYIGTKEFYKMALLVAVPIMLQNGITNLVGMLDNIMVGQLGTEQMTGVSVVNQLIFVFNLCIFGGVSGAGIFSAQFFGKGDHVGVRDAFRFKLITCLVLTALGFFIFGFFGDDLISLYLHGKDGAGDKALTLEYGSKFLKVMMIEMLPFAIVQAYVSTLRDTGETVIAMKAGIIAVLINVSINYLLIYGMFGLPELGVVGAAVGTIIARLVELGIVVRWTHKHKERNKFIIGVYKKFKIPMTLVKSIILTGTPLLVNEALWAGGMATLALCYSMKGMDVVSGLNISNTIANVFNIVFIALGTAIGIIVGQQLGAGKYKEASDSANKLIAFSVVVCFIIGLMLASIAGIFPNIYHTTDAVKHYATQFIIVVAIYMPMYAYLHSMYFTIRSGGKTIITFLFDSVYLWLIAIPTAFLLVKFSSLPILPIYIICQSMDFIKCIIGYCIYKKGIWIQNIVSK